MLRHFALLLLFCSLISLAVSTDTTETNPDVHGAQSPLREEVDALEHGRIVAVKPIHFLNEDRKNEKLHPAVFVGIEKETGIVKVVVMSTTFTEQNVPSHLRASVGVYFPGVIKFYALGREQDLKGELDLSKYRELEWGNIVIEGTPTIMKRRQFKAMSAKIDSNVRNRGIKPFVPKGEGSEQLASAPPTGGKPGKFDHVVEGEIVYINFQTSKLQTSETSAYPAIFVSWTGDGTLAVVPMSIKCEGARNTAEVGKYSFSPRLAEKSLQSKLILNDYLIVHLNVVRFVWDKRSRKVMENESLQRLREEIDSNIKIWKKNKAKNDSKKRTKAARKAGADGSDKVPQTGKGAVSEGKGT